MCDCHFPSAIVMFCVVFAMCGTTTRSCRYRVDMFVPPCPVLDCQVCRGLYLVFSALLGHRVLGRTMLYPTRLLVSMHCCCLGHIVVPCQVAGFHALLQWAHSHALPGCWVPCMAAVFRLLYSARLLSSMHCCCLYIVIPLQVAGFHV